MQDNLNHLRETRAQAKAVLKKLTDKASSEKRDFTAAEDKAAREAALNIRELNVRIDEYLDEMTRAGYFDPEVQAIRRGISGGGSSAWSARAADAMQKMGGGGENRAISSGSVDVPHLIDPAVTPKSRPSRLTDLLVNRAAVESNAYEYFRQSTRTTNATAVADLGTKPTSVYSVAQVIDRCRVLAHLSEPVPTRLWRDATEVVRWLDGEMRAGLLDALEAQVISGSGSGENLTGILTVSGTTQVAFATDVPTTLRKAQTALQAIGVAPNALVVNQNDAEALDLLKEGTGGVGYLLDGYLNGTASSGNVLGTVTRVISPSVPAGVAVLADWSAAKLFVRQDMTLDVDTGGDLFKTNSAVMRCEMRIGLGHLHPASVAIVDLTA